jgi:hypothetical protein
MSRRTYVPILIHVKYESSVGLAPKQAQAKATPEML